ncbi:MAG: TonB-dependent receptor plug domain-containing protein, partial [Gammaproteobacteria bacterium]|nr:TonB-dependent receptor plug domain-containing protein [Gammaproteobacteria bacterium]
MKKTNKLLSVAVATAMGLSVNVSAQDGAEEVTEEVVVTGIRSSLKKSMDIKRDSIGVVDAISAEDIGKFPDTNLAESLQRITGVSIDRSVGEGNSVT